MGGHAIACHPSTLLLYWLGLTVSAPENTRVGPGSVYVEQFMAYSSQERLSAFPKAFKSQIGLIYEICYQVSQRMSGVELAGCLYTSYEDPFKRIVAEPARSSIQSTPNIQVHKQFDSQAGSKTS